MTSSAKFSECRRYRYELWRAWSELPCCLFIGLNPSTADETKDDPTIRRCIGFARHWGFGAMCMCNLFAFRATNPLVMKAALSPIGLQNDEAILRVAGQAGMVVAAWGRDGSHMNRGPWVAGKITTLQCLGKNNDGTPKHPLYLSKSTMPVPYL